MLNALQVLFLVSFEHDIIMCNIMEFQYIVKYLPYIYC